MSLYLYFLVLAPIVSGLILYILKTKWHKSIAVTLQVFMVVVVTTLSLSSLLNTHYFALITTPVPYGMALSLDAVAAPFILLNNILFLLLTVFGIKKDYMNPLFMFLFLSLQGMINGLFLSTDLFNIYVLIEVATITISILIMFRRDRQSMYDGMLYLTINMIAMAFFLFGIAVLYKLFGVLDIATLNESIHKIENPKLLNLPFAFLLTGIGLKAAILPLFSWLPKAHGTASAPSTVSAVLSGIFVKIGIYLLIRLQVLFSPEIDVQSIIFVIGFMTSIAGFIFAIAQTDIKLILAYHTVSQVGLILIGISGASITNYYGGLYHVLSHGMFKSLFFIIAGILIHHYGTRKISKMKGLWQHNRRLSIILLMAILSITGAPFFSGGYSKYFISYGYESMLTSFVFQFINWGTMISFIKFILIVFSRPDENPPSFVIKFSEWIALWSFGLISLALGVFGSQLSGSLLGFSMQYSLINQIQKLPLFLISYSGCYVFYNVFIKKNPIVDRIRLIELSFNSINIAIVSFFFFTLTYLNAQ